MFFVGCFFFLADVFRWLFFLPRQNLYNGQTEIRHTRQWFITLTVAHIPLIHCLDIWIIEICP